MLLANEDVERIKKQTNLPIQKFSYIKDGYLYLKNKKMKGKKIKNKKKYCVFLNYETKKCSIYVIRPIGCRYYPIIYDPFLKNCIVDKDCTNKENVQTNLVSCPELQKFILLLERERNNRIILQL